MFEQSQFLCAQADPAIPSETLSPRNPHYWAERFLHYTDHAVQQAYGRNLPIIPFLPSHAVLVWSGDDPTGETLFKFCVLSDAKPVYLLLGETAVGSVRVITLHGENPKPRKSYDRLREKSRLHYWDRGTDRSPDFLFFGSEALTRRERLRRASRSA
jgi:hypothetical protein